MGWSTDVIQKGFIENQFIIKKIIKTKIKSYGDKINTNFHDTKKPNEGFQKY